MVKFLTVLHNVQFPLLTKSLKLPGSQSTHTDDMFSVLPTSQTKIRKLKMRSGLDPLRTIVWQPYLIKYLIWLQLLMQFIHSFSRVFSESGADMYEIKFGSQTHRNSQTAKIEQKDNYWPQQFKIYLSLAVNRNEKFCFQHYEKSQKCKKIKTDRNHQPIVFRCSLYWFPRHIACTSTPASDLSVNRKWIYFFNDDLQ